MLHTKIRMPAIWSAIALDINLIFSFEVFSETVQSVDIYQAHAGAVSISHTL